MANYIVTVESNDVVNVKYYFRDSDISGKDAFSTVFFYDLNLFHLKTSAWSPLF